VRSEARLSSWTVTELISVPVPVPTGSCWRRRDRLTRLNLGKAVVEDLLSGKLAIAPPISMS
jgi:hypothetical protein